MPGEVSGGRGKQAASGLWRSEGQRDKKSEQGWAFFTLGQKQFTLFSIWGSRLSEEIL